MTNVTTDEMKKNFQKSLEKLGINPADVADHCTGECGETKYLTDEPGVKSLVPARKMAVHSLDELKELAGVADEQYNSGKQQRHMHEDLPSWDSSKSNAKIADLSAEDNSSIAKAFKTYVYGDSTKVSSYKDVIENNYFPMTLAVYAGNTLTVPENTAYPITGSNAVATWETVTLKKGASLDFQVNAHWTIQNMVVES